MSAKSLILLVITILLLQNSNCNPAARSKRFVKSPTQFRYSTGADLWRRFYKQFDYLYPEVGKSVEMWRLNVILKSVIEKLSALNGENPDVENELNELVDLSNRAEKQMFEKYVLYSRQIDLLSQLLDESSNFPEDLESSIVFMNLREEFDATQQNLFENINLMFDGSEKFHPGDVLSEMENQGARIFYSDLDPERRDIFDGMTIIRASVREIDDSADETTDENEAGGYETTEGGNSDERNVSGEEENIDGRDVVEDTTDVDEISEENASGDKKDDSNVDGENVNHENTDEDKVDSDSTEETTDGGNIGEENVSGENRDGEKTDESNDDGEKVSDGNNDEDSVDGENSDENTTDGVNIGKENANGENTVGEKNDDGNVDEENVNDENNDEDNVDGENTHEETTD